ncbi:C2H2 finger domain transcription factor [Colletotrichum camelliae]|nr:C2H2 finger domain transcription factor [Colletotrichum camelliae]
MSDSQTAMAGSASYRHNSESSEGYLGEEKTFTCSHPGCSKRFTRAEHMQRHALNHQPGGLSCDLCSAHFKRPDLLKRHMDRHRQKDLEAGGPGFGVLDTRKRSWKAPDGSVVEKRPCPYPPGRGRTSGRARPQTTQVPSPEPEPTDGDQSVSSFDATGEQDFSVGSISPDIHRRHTVDLRPASFDSNQSYPFDRGNLFATSETVNDFAGFPPALQFHDFGASDNQFDLDANQPINWGDPFSSEHLDYDQIFQPDTASSFNMPYTTALDYNWLFNMQEAAGPMITSKTSTQEYSTQLPENPSITRTQTNIAITPESMKSAQLWNNPMDVAPTDNSGQDKPPSYNTVIQSAPQELPPREPPRRPAPRSSVERNSDMNAARRAAEASGPTRKRYTAVSRPAPILEPERPLSSLRKPLNTPTIDEKIRERLLNTVDAAKPCLPDQRYTIWEHPLLSVDSLNSYLHLFFTRFNTAYHLMHLETFECADTEPLLLLSILLLGATYSSKDCHQLAVCIHDVIRPSIFAHAGFSPRPELWTLQTILLVECFGKSRAGQKQHDMSHLFHGLLINLIRRSDCQSVRPPGPPPVGGDESAGSLDKLWKKWAEAEQKKRLALLCFMWDTQHAVLFCQSLCMSAFELRLELPCNQSIWEARDATEWVSAWRSSISDQRTFYLPVLKAYLMPSGPRTHGLSGFSRILVLHGLMSVAWDMGRRDQTALGVISGESPGPGSGWRKTLSSGYDAWRSDFDWYCNNFFAQMPRGPPSPDDDVRKMEFESFTAAYKALYHSAQALLNMDFLDVQIYAGARHILGRPVQQKDYMRSAQVVKRWAAATNNGPGEAQGSRPGESSAATPSDQSVGQRQSATAAAWHAAQMLRETKKTLSGTEAMNLFHVPWCLYLATLTCWAYHHARPNRNYGVPSRRNFDAMGEFDEDEDCEEDEMIWDPQGEMDALISSMSERVERNDATLRREKRRTNGLVWIMADILTTVRWGIVHAGVVVLRGLVPQRLINQYEEAI